MFLKFFQKFGIRELISSNLIKSILMEVITEIFAHDQNLKRTVNKYIDKLSEKTRNKLIEKVEEL